MSHLVAFPEDMYQAIAKYAANHGQTAEEVIFAWGKTIKDQVIPSQGANKESEAAIYNPANDPLAKYLGAGEATSPDVLDRHDFYLGESYADDHKSQK